MLALGGGGALAYWYYVRAAAVARDGGVSALHSLWPNVATELLGVWMSVRIIDTIVRARDERSSTRQAIATDLAFMGGLANRVRRTDGDAVEELFAAIRDFDDATPRRSRRLSTDEQRDVSRAIEAARRLANHGDQVIRLESLADTQLIHLPGSSLGDLKAAYLRGRRTAWSTVPDVKRELGTVQAGGAREQAFITTVRDLCASAVEMIRMANEYQRLHRAACHNILEEELR